MDSMIDDDDWLDIEPAVKAGAVLADVSLRLSIMRGSKALAFVTCRGPARAWIEANGPRFRAQIGGPDADRVRIVADAAGGRFEAHQTRGPKGRSGDAVRLNLGHITAWPNEMRDPVACSFKIDATVKALVLTLPAGFAKAKPVPVVAPPPPVRAESPIVTRVIDRRLTGAVSMGEPPPGRSALDQRRARV